MKADKGSIEALLTLPLLTLIGWGVAYFSVLLLQKIKTEQAAWVYGIERSNQSSRVTATRRINKSFDFEKPSFDLMVSEQGMCTKDQSILLSLANTIPLAFTSFLLSHCSKEAKIQSRRSIPKNLGDFLSFLPSDLSFKALFWVKGDDFKESKPLRQALWQEAMMNAGFGALPMQMLGVPELTKAASIVGLGALGGPAMAILSKL